MTEGNHQRAAPPGPQPRLGDLLLRAGVISPGQLENALAEQRKWGGRLGRILVDLGCLDERTMGLALSRQLGLPCIDLQATQLSPSVTELLSVQHCEQLGVMPVGADPVRRVLRLATPDPTNLKVLEEVAAHTGHRVEAVIAGAQDIDRAIRRYYYGDERRATTVTLPGFTTTDSAEKMFSTPAAPAPAFAAAPAPPAADLAGLTERLDRLEQLATHQTRALRVLVEMLVESGLVDRESFQKRARGQQ